MPLLKDKDREYLKGEFTKRLTSPVKLLFFTQTLECPTCELARQIYEEVASLSDQISLTKYNFVLDKEQVEKYRVDKIPTLVVEGAKDYGIRFYGLPSGYEFTSLIEDIFDVAAGSTRLAKETKEALAKLAKPVHLQVFVTPT